MLGYRPLSMKEFDQAGDNLVSASYPFLAEVIVDPYAPLEALLSKKPKSLRAKPALSQSKSKPSSSKTLFYPALMILPQPSFHALDDVSVRDLNLSICLRMINRSEGLVYGKPLAKDQKDTFGKLFPIIRDNDLRSSGSAYDMLSDEFLHMLSCDGY
uniref:Uncharacterized protein n=1 Tax=Tanacetum cinerariifolium TaxID=118510 RepID=A0A6L2NF90_TANCI|nr:hypothetical protein [Tanacetum cinerariifolium]